MTGHVLFIDQLDNEIMEIKLSLEEQGVRVSVQPNPLRAVNEAKVNVPDVIVTEVLTRPVGGLEMAFAISHGKHGFTAPVIFYTEFYRDERTRRDITAKYGAIHYFVKPFQREALKKAIWVILEESSHFRYGGRRQSEADAPQEALPPKPVHEDETAMQSPIAEPITSQHSLLVESLPIESLPARNRLVLPEPLKKQGEVGPDLKSVAPVIPVEVPNVEIIPRSEPEKGEVEIARIQVPPTPEEHKPDVLLQADPNVSPKPTDTAEPVVLPLRPVKELNRTWAILARLLVISFAVLFFLWHRFGRLSPTQVNGPSFEAQRSSSPSVPPANPAPTPAEVSHEGGAMPHESGAEYSAETPSDVSAQVKSPSVPPSEPVNETPGQKATLSPRPELAVTDISISMREPQLMHMKKPALNNESLRQMGTETFVVRVVIDGKGKVREVTPLNGDKTVASLPQDLLDTIWQWEYRAVAKREGEFFVKHYSFKVAFP